MRDDKGDFHFECSEGDIRRRDILELLLSEGAVEASVGLWMSELSTLIRSELTAAPDVVMPTELLTGKEPTEGDRQIQRWRAENARRQLMEMWELLTQWRIVNHKLHEDGGRPLRLDWEGLMASMASSAWDRIVEASVEKVEESIKETDWPIKLREMLMEIWNDSDGAIYGQTRQLIESHRLRKERMRGRTVRRGPDGKLELTDDEPNAD